MIITREEVLEIFEEAGRLGIRYHVVLLENSVHVRKLPPSPANKRRNYLRRWRERVTRDIKRVRKRAAWEVTDCIVGQVA